MFSKLIELIAKAYKILKNKGVNIKNALDSLKDITMELNCLSSDSLKELSAKDSDSLAAMVKKIQELMGVIRDTSVPEEIELQIREALTNLRTSLEGADTDTDSSGNNDFDSIVLFFRTELDVYIERIQEAINAHERKNKIKQKKEGDSAAANKENDKKLKLEQIKQVLLGKAFRYGSMHEKYKEIHRLKLKMSKVYTEEDWRKIELAIVDPDSDVRKTLNELVKYIPLLAPDEIQSLAFDLTLSTICHEDLLEALCVRLVEFNKPSEIDLDFVVVIAKLLAEQRASRTETINVLFTVVGHPDFTNRLVIDSAGIMQWGSLVRSLGIIRDINDNNTGICKAIDAFTQTVLKFVVAHNEKIKQCDAEIDLAKKQASTKIKKFKVGNCIRQFCAQLTHAQQAAFDKSYIARYYLPSRDNTEKSLFGKDKESEFSKTVFAGIKSLLPGLKQPIKCSSKQNSIDKKVVGEQILGYQHSNDSQAFIKKEYRISPYNYDIVIQQGKYRHVVEINGGPFHFLIQIKKDGTVCTDHLNGSSLVKEKYILNRTGVHNVIYTFTNINQSAWEKRVKANQTTQFLKSVIPAYFWEKPESGVKPFVIPTAPHLAFCACQQLPLMHNTKLSTPADVVVPPMDAKSKAAIVEAAKVANAGTAAAPQQSVAATATAAQGVKSAVIVPPPVMINPIPTVHGVASKTVFLQPPLHQIPATAADGIATDNMPLKDDKSTGLHLKAVEELNQLIRVYPTAKIVAVNCIQLAQAAFHNFDYGSEIRYLNDALVHYANALTFNLKLRIYGRNYLNDYDDITRRMHQINNTLQKAISRLNGAALQTQMMQPQSIQQTQSVSAATQPVVVVHPMAPMGFSQPFVQVTGETVLLANTVVTAATAVAMAATVAAPQTQCTGPQ